MRGLQEVVPIQDTLVTGIGAIERLEGGLVRVWLYVSQSSEDSQVPEKVVVAKIVGSTGGIPDVLLQLMAAIGPRTVSAVPVVAGLLMN